MTPVEIEKPIRTVWQRLMDPEEWSTRMGGLPPQDRADVAKTRITEVEATKRTRIEEREKTRLAANANENTHIVRGVAVVAVLVAFISAALLASAYINAWHDIQSKKVTGIAIPDFNIPALTPPPAPAQPSK